jgi:hypothetical protein
MSGVHIQIDFVEKKALHTLPKKVVFLTLHMPIMTSN